MDLKAEIFQFGGAVSSDFWILWWAFQDLEAFLARKVWKAFAALILFPSNGKTTSDLLAYTERS